MTALRITNGTLTANLIWNSSTNKSYMLARDGWAPAVAGRRRSALGGSELFLPVVEEIDVYAIGETAAEALGNVETLAILLDQAERWSNQEVLSPVVMQYTPTGGIRNNQAVILGRAPGDETNGVNFDVTFNQQLNAFMILVRLRLWRRGYWCDDAQSASAAAATNPSVLAISLAPVADIPMPIEIDLTGFTTSVGTGTAAIPPGYIAIGPTGFADLQEGEAGAAVLPGLATFTSTGDAAARPSGGAVGRLDHTLAGGIQATNIAWSLPASFLNARRIRVMMTFRNNGGTGWYFWMQGERGAYVARTPTEYLAAVATDPEVHVFADLSSPYGFDTVRLQIGLQSGSGTTTLDIDTILTLDLTDPTAVVLAHNGAERVLGAAFASANAQVAIQHDPLTKLTPQLRLDVPSVAGGQFPIDYGGDVALHQIGSGIDVVWYATQLYNGTTPYWRTQNNAGAATLSIGATAVRRRASITPK